MPQGRKPVSASVIAFISGHSRRASMASGISRGSRPILRHQPQLRLDCSPAMWPFSHNTTGTPLRARKKAVQVPMMPPPTTTTEVRTGRSVLDVTVSTRGAMQRFLWRDDWRHTRFAVMICNDDRSWRGFLGLHQIAEAGAEIAVADVGAQRSFKRAAGFGVKYARTGIAAGWHPLGIKSHDSTRIEVRPRLSHARHHTLIHITVFAAPLAAPAFAQRTRGLRQRADKSLGRWPQRRG